jgi:hypothetical protein
MDRSNKPAYISVPPEYFHLYHYQCMFFFKKKILTITVVKQKQRHLVIIFLAHVQKPNDTFFLQVAVKEAMIKND